MTPSFVVCYVYSHIKSLTRFTYLFHRKRSMSLHVQDKVSNYRYKRHNYRHNGDELRRTSSEVEFVLLYYPDISMVIWPFWMLTAKRPIMTHHLGALFFLSSSWVYIVSIKCSKWYSCIGWHKMCAFGLAKIRVFFLPLLFRKIECISCRFISTHPSELLTVSVPEPRDSHHMRC